MILQTTELKQFKAKAAGIPTNTLLPIYGYLLLANNSITKYAGQSFITMAITYDEPPLLVDEKILMSFVGMTSQPTITVTVTGKQILITDGTTKDNSPTDDPSLFTLPSTPPEADGTDITDALTHIATAAIINQEDELNVIRSHVNIGNGLIAATDNNIAFVQPMDGVPEMVLSKNVAATVGRLEASIFSENENYHFFRSGTCIFGFVKPAIKLANFSPFIVALADLPSFVLDKREILSFNEHALSSNNLPTVTVALSLGTVLHLETSNKYMERTITRDMICGGAMDGVFGYNAAILNRLLKALPCTEIIFTRVGNKLYLTSPDFTFVALAMQVDI